MSIIRPRVWTQQPQIATGIDWSNPLVDKLTSAVIPFAGYDACIQKVLGVLGTKPASSARSKGVAILPVSGGVTLPGVDAVRISTPPVTVIAVFERVGSLAQWARIADCAYNGNNQDGGWDINATASNGVRFGLWSGGAYQSLDAGVVPLNTPTVLVGTHDGTNAKAYINGALVAGPSALPFSATTRTDPYAIGCARNASSPGNGWAIYLVGSFNRAMSTNEVADISANPWQIFAPRVT